MTIEIIHEVPAAYYFTNETLKTFVQQFETKKQELTREVEKLLS